MRGLVGREVTDLGGGRWANKKPKKKGIRENPYGLNQFSNLLTVDWPYGIGFSVTKSGKPPVPNPEKGVEAYIRFLIRWFDEHPEYQENDIYLSGDSSSGMYCPIIYRNML